jgi:threonine/homoserine/homoserine lactone efflux protein
MYDLLQMLFLGFVIGLTGALAPGPTLVATINASLTGDWTTGLKISLGHLIAETVIFLLIIMGLATVALPYSAAISGIGGISLIMFGILTITGSRKATLHFSPARTITNPYIAGLVTSAANPYFLIWWLSIGSAMVIAGLQGGLVLAGIFMIGHWCSDIGWFTLVSTTVSQGTTILTDTSYRNIVALCGIFLVLFGVYYLSRILVL